MILDELTMLRTPTMTSLSGVLGREFMIGRSTLVRCCLTTASRLRVNGTRSMSSEYRVAGARWTLWSAVPPRIAMLSRRNSSLKIAATQRVMSRSCSTWTSLGHGAVARHAMISR